MQSTIKTLTLGQKLKIYRALYNLSQGELAKSLGVARLTILRIEKGKTVPHNELYYKLTKVLKLHLDDLLQPIIKDLPEFERKPEVLKKYKVTLKRSYDCYFDLIVEATSQSEAEAIVEEKSENGDIDFDNNQDAHILQEYIYDVKELKNEDNDNE